MLALIWSDNRIARVAVARFIARLGGEAAFFIGVWGLAAYRFKGTPFQIAAMMAVLSVSTMVGSALAGGLVDRYGPRNVLVGAQLLYAPVAILMPFVGSLKVMILACAAFGLVSAPIFTASGSFAPYLTEDTDKFARINALLDGSGSVSFVLGPAAGALVSRLFGLGGVFYFDAALTTIAALLVLAVPTPPAGGVSKQRHAFAEAIEGIRITYSMKAVRYYVLLGTVTWLGFGSFGALEPLFFRDVVKTGIETIGVVNSVFGAGLVIGAWVLSRIPPEGVTAKTLAVGVAASGLCSAVYVGWADIRIVLFGALLWGAVLGAVEPLLRTLMQIDSPQEVVGRVMGTSQIHRSAGEIVPLAFAPALVAIFGVQRTMIGGGIFAAIVSLLTLGHAASIDRGGHVGRGAAPVETGFALDEPLNPLD